MGAQHATEVTSPGAWAMVAANPDAVFRTLTDIAGLPSWNARMASVIDQPSALEVGAEWVVEFHVLRRTWRSVGSRVTVAWELHPVTFWRRVLLGRIRARQLARTEIPASLAALGAASKRATTG